MHIAQFSTGHQSEAFPFQPNQTGESAMKICLVIVSALVISATTLLADNNSHNCRDLPGNSQLKQLLNNSASPAIGGLFNGERMWAAVVNRDGELCGAATSTDDRSQVWPGSQAIAKAKAYTANAFSLDTLPLSTARLYTFTQPGHSLWSLANANPFDPNALDSTTANQDTGGNKIAGGMIFFGGGVPLYKNGKIIGGLGVSGDTSCADHEVAKKVRDLAGLNPPGGPGADDITFTVPDGASAFTHPKCINTKRNGVSLGDEAPASGY